MSFINQFRIIRPTVVFYRVLFASFGIITAQLLSSFIPGLSFSLNQILLGFLIILMCTIHYEYTKMKAYHSKRYTIKMTHD